MSRWRRPLEFPVQVQALGNRSVLGRRGWWGHGRRPNEGQIAWPQRRSCIPFGVCASFQRFGLVIRIGPDDFDQSRGLFGTPKFLRAFETLVYQHLGSLHGYSNRQRWRKTRHAQGIIRRQVSFFFAVYRSYFTASLHSTHWGKIHILSKKS